MTALVLTDLVKHFPGSRAGQVVHAVNGVSLELKPGETLAMVGESGSGKSTIGRVALRLDRPTSGRIVVDGRDITEMPMAEVRKLRPQMQMVFQDPWGTLNPRMTIGDLIEEPLLLHSDLSRAARRERAADLAGQVRLDRRLLERYPAQLSGGQLQRVAIARAIATSPRLIVLDEPTSSLDLSVRAEILTLLAELRTATNAAFLFITHDLGTVRLIADRVIVLYLGSVMEAGPAEAIFRNPQHPYTQVLFSAQLPTDPEIQLTRYRLEGEIPSPVNLPPGCPFSSRCPAAIAACSAARPPLAALPTQGHEVACIRVADGGNILAR